MTRCRFPHAVTLACIAVVGASAWSAAQQPRDTTRSLAPAGGTAVVSGTVMTDEAQAHPVRRATVTMAGTGLRGSRDAVTDDQGRFAFAGLPAGGYTLSVTKAGWITTYYGSRRPGVRPYGAAPLIVSDGEHNTSVALRLLHGSAITGTILDQSGRPAGVVVRLLQFRMSNGQRTLVAASGVNAAVSTDDRGVYRLYDIAPGEYVLSAVNQSYGGAALHQVTPDVLQSAQRAIGAGPVGPPASEPSNQGPTVGYANVYYPGTADIAAATTVKVGPNEEKAGVDFALQLVPTAEMSGAIVPLDGQPPARVQVQLLPRDSMVQADDPVLGNLAGLSLAPFIRVQPDGTFKASSVAPGQYTILVRAADRSVAPSGITPDAVGPLGRLGGAGPLTLWATQDVTVNGRDISGMTLNLQPGMTVSGRVTSDLTGKAAFDFTRLAVSLTAVDQVGSLAPMPVEADGAFRLSGVVPGRYRLNVSANADGRRGGAPSGGSAWSVASAFVAGHDAIDLPFHVQPGENVADATIKLTSALGEISGTLRDAAGQPAHDYVIVVFSADRAYWTTTGRRMPSPTATSRDGTFRLSNLPAGEYFAVAATDIDPDTLHDPVALEVLSAQAVRITLANGEKKVQDFQIGGGHE